MSDRREHRFLLNVSISNVGDFVIKFSSEYNSFGELKVDISSRYARSFDKIFRANK